MPSTLLQAREAGRAAFRKPEAELSYLDWYRTTIPRGWGVPKHIEFLCGLIQKVIDGEIQRLCISTPPGHAKSDTITRRLPLYLGLRNPEKVSVFTGYNQRFAETRLSKPCREIAETLGILSPDATAMDEWRLSNGAQIVARGVGSAPTGVNPIDLLICDDPIKDQAQAESAIERENIWDWWTGSIVQRFWPSTKAIIIATRWHEDDLIGRLKDSNDPSWTFVNLPAIAGYDDPLGRIEGEALWPGGKPIDFLQEQRKAMGERQFQALFQGNPTPREGSFFKVSKLQVVKAIPGNLPNCLSFDNAATEDDGDWSAGPWMHGPDADGIYYVLPWRVRKEPSERNDLMRQRADLLKPRYVTVPRDPSAGKEVAQIQIKRFAGHTVTDVPRRKGETKLLVADPFAAQVNAGNVRVVMGPHDAYERDGKPHSYAADYIEELRTFPLGANDDQVDASADAFNRLTVPKGWSHDMDAVRDLYPGKAA